MTTTPGTTHLPARPRVAGPAAAVLAVLLLTGPGTAAAEPGAEVTCGYLSTDTTLTADLDCSGSDVGLQLADGVDLDLGGHVLRGDGNGTGIDLLGSSTVRGGAVTGWAVGVLRAPRAAVPDGEVVLQDVTVTDSGVGALLDARTVRVERTTLRRNVTGLVCRTACTVRDGTFTDHEAIALQSSGGLDVADSTFRANRWGVSLLLAATPSTVRGSTFFDNTVGVQLEHSRATVVDNVLRRNGTGISTADAPTRQPFTGTHELRGNLLNANTDGIVSTSTAVRLRGNVAMSNTGWGIHAPSATNLGGNVAAGNGKSPQCVCGS